MLVRESITDDSKSRIGFRQTLDEILKAVLEHRVLIDLRELRLAYDEHCFTLPRFPVRRAVHFDERLLTDNELKVTRRIPFRLEHIVLIRAARSALDHPWDHVAIPLRARPNARVVAVIVQLEKHVLIDGEDCVETREVRLNPKSGVVS